MVKNKSNVAHAIWALRDKLGFTQVEFAQYMGLAQSTVSSWEIGSRPKMSPTVAVRFMPIFKQYGIKVALEDLI